MFTAVGYVYHRERGDYFNAKNAKDAKFFGLVTPIRRLCVLCALCGERGLGAA